MFKRAALDRARLADLPADIVPGQATKFGVDLPGLGGTTGAVGGLLTGVLGGLFGGGEPEQPAVEEGPVPTGEESTPAVEDPAPTEQEEKPSITKRLKGLFKRGSPP